MGILDVVQMEKFVQDHTSSIENPFTTLLTTSTPTTTFTTPLGNPTGFPPNPFTTPLTTSTPTMTFTTPLGVSTGVFRSAAGQAQPYQPLLVLGGILLAVLYCA
ncbi:hypothetical protein BYT27DRAFT_7250211 [Phlegmacium glaucopus]|nr:hypothetical protein BYT27DRAFT_7250211 [Phlegmacium glaucopus]